ncbi:hypothetical protein KR222_001827, partial [Zaprionus bogoriensis]
FCFQRHLPLLLSLCLVLLLHSATAGKVKLFAFKGPHGGFVKLKARSPKLLGLKHGLVGAGLGFGAGIGAGVGLAGGFGGGHGGGGGYEHHEEYHHHESHYSSGGSYGGGSYGGGLWGK